MTKEGPTLIDSLLRETFSPVFRHLDKGGWLRKHLLEARRFVADDSMSAFMADLAYASMPKVRNVKRDQEFLDGMRVMSRVPHRVTWIEYNLRARVQRAKEKYNVHFTDSETPRKGGWLIVQHPQVETAFLIAGASSDTIGEGIIGYDIGGPLVPIASPHFVNWVWRTDDGPLPYPALLKPDNLMRPETYLTGMMTYHSDQVGVIRAPYYDFNKIDPIKARHMMTGWAKQNASDLRYIWSFLSSLNDIPTITNHVRPEKGFVARGSYRKFLDHTTIHLKIPGTVDSQTFARRVMRAARRRAHQVRGHWRKDWRHPLHPLCDHTFEAHDDHLVCKSCSGRETWIAEHQRGDASLGFVTHDYSVEHDRENPR